MVMAHIGWITNQQLTLPGCLGSCGLREVGQTQVQSGLGPEFRCGKAIVWVDFISCGFPAAMGGKHIKPSGIEGTGTHSWIQEAHTSVFVHLSIGIAENVGRQLAGRGKLPPSVPFCLRPEGIQDILQLLALSFPGTDGVHHALQSKCLVTNDSDFICPLSIVAQSPTNVILVNPFIDRNRTVKGIGTLQNITRQSLRTEFLKDNQLPNPVTASDSRKLYKPQAWNKKPST